MTGDSNISSTGELGHAGEEDPTGLSPADSVAAPSEGKDLASEPQATGPELFPSASLFDRLKTAHGGIIESFNSEVTGASGQWAAGHVPGVRKMLQDAQGVELDDALLLRLGETRHAWESAEGRIRECARCTGPALQCAESSVGLSPGAVVRLRVTGAELTHPTLERSLRPCQKFQSAKVDQFLLRAGVSPRFQSARLSNIINPSFDEDPKSKISLQNTQRAFAHVVARMKEHTDVTLLIQGKLCREYGVALLAECLTVRGYSGKSVHVPTLVREERIAMATRTNGGFLLCMEDPVLVLDDVEQAQLDSKHWLDEILWLQGLRRDRCFVTIITTTILKPTLKDTFPGARALFVEKKK